MTFYLKDFIKNVTLFYILLAFAIVGAFILLYYGYIFVCLYGVIVLRRNIGMFFVILALFVPVFLLALLIVGFLYAAGPLRNYLENRVNQINNNLNRNE